MIKTTGRVVVADLELTCWEGKPPEGEAAEIIEIGYCITNLDTMTRSEPVSVKIRPARSTVSAYCTELTGWTAKDLRSGQPFADACKTLTYKAGLRQYPWCSWGIGDQTAIASAVAESWAPYPFSEQHFDLSTLYSLLLGRPLRSSQESALEFLGIEPVGRAHVGAWDAYNAAGILLELVRRCRG